MPCTEFSRFVQTDGKVNYTFINFKDDDGNPFSGLSNDEFADKIRHAFKSYDVDSKGEIGYSYNNGKLISQENEDYGSRITSLGGPDLLYRADNWRKEFEALVERYRSEGGTTQGGKATPTPEEVIPTSSETLSPGQLSGSPPDEGF